MLLTTSTLHPDPSVAPARCGLRRRGAFAWLVLAFQPGRAVGVPFEEVSMWSWKATRQPRPNVKTHPLDAYLLADRLRGGEIEDERPEAIIVYLFAFFLVLAFVGIILLAVEL